MQIYKQLLLIVGSELNEETADFSPKQITVLHENSEKILARMKFNDSIVYFKICATILIVSAGGGLYIFDLATFKKLESLQCNSVFQTYMRMNKNDESKVDIFRIIFCDPSLPGQIKIFSCKYKMNFANLHIDLDEHT